MKKLRNLLCLVLLGLMATGTASAQNGSDVDPDGDNMIEVGAAGMVNDGAMDAILHIKTNVTYGADKEDGYFVIVRMNADGSITSGNFNYVDISMNALGYGIASDEAVLNGFIEGTLLNINYKRNIAIDLDHQLTISLVGLRTGGSLEINKNVKVMAETALDFAAVGLVSKRASDAASLSKSGSKTGLNARIEVAVELFKKVRIALGAKGSTIGGKGVEYETGNVICNSTTDGWYDSWGYYHSQTYTNCYNETATDYRQSWKQREIYLSFVAKITENLKVFGRAGYNIFKVNDKTAEVANSKSGAWAFMLGVSYTIPYKPSK